MNCGVTGVFGTTGTTGTSTGGAAADGEAPAALLATTENVYVVPSARSVIWQAWVGAITVQVALPGAPVTT